MNASRLISMVIRMGTGFLTKRAMDAARTPEEKASVRKRRRTARQVQRATRMAQRIGKF